MFANLEVCERRVHSQNGEDGVIEAIFARLGTTNRYFVEFGCEDAVECNSAYLLEQGWSGLLMDSKAASNNPLAKIEQAFITAENINSHFERYGVPQSFDLLSIDIDGNDFWVWQQITARPRVVVIEYNPHIPPDECRTIVYEPSFIWNGSDYYGASLLALQELGRRKGYTLIHCERAGVNAFFVADELLPSDYRPRSISEIYRPPNFWYRGWCFPEEVNRQMINPFLSMSDLYFHIGAGWIQA